MFKEKLAEFPLEEAPRKAADFTRLDFGWWAFNEKTQPDMYEYGTSKAAAWDCPVTILMGHLSPYETNPRTKDIFEVLKRWEDVRKKKWLSNEQKEALKNPNQEFTLLINEAGAYELVPYTQIKTAARGDDRILAFSFERAGKSYVVFWHKEGSGKLLLPLAAEDVLCEEALGGEKVAIKNSEQGLVLSVENKRYISTTADKETLIKAFENATFID